MTEVSSIGNKLISIIIPCYRSNYLVIRTLSSIFADISKCIINEDDIEIILVMDECDDEFKSVIRTVQYSSDFLGDYRIYSIDDVPGYIHCPGNTREMGLRNATGKWITFIDHDDFIHPGFFNLVGQMKFVNSLVPSNVPVIRTKFWEMDNDMRITREFDIDDGAYWLHGKVYNNQFIKDHSIHFMNNMVFHEDQYFNSVVYAHATGNALFPYDINLCNYIYMISKNSQSRSNFIGNPEYSNRYLNDYVTALTAPYLNAIKLYPDKSRSYITSVSANIIKLWLFVNLMMNKSYGDQILYGKDYFSNLMHKIYEELDVTPEHMYNLFDTKLSSIRDKEYAILRRSHGNFDIKISFMDFLNS